VQAGLPTNQSIDTPTAGDPNGTAGLGQVSQHPKHLTKTHALACSVGQRSCAPVDRNIDSRNAASGRPTSKIIIATY
jgi:hypothetical protein